MIHIHENFLSPEECGTLVAEAEANSHFSSGAVGGGKVNPYIRKVDVLSIGGGLNERLNARVKTLLGQDYGVEFKPNDAPIQLLKYVEGGHYTAHNDAQRVTMTDGRWTARRFFDRDLSIVIYLNEDFEGGNFVFDHLDRRIVPKQGMLLAFPSDWRHEHHVEPTSKGTRYALVNWYATETPFIEDGEIDEEFVPYYQASTLHFIHSQQKVEQEVRDVEERDKLARFLKRKRAQ